jgi:Zn-dependent protease with chaperone function
MTNASTFYRSFVLFLLLVLRSAAQTPVPPTQPGTPRQYTLTDDQRAKAKAYARARNLLYFASEAVLFGALIAMFRSRKRWLQRGRWAVPCVLLVLLAAQSPIDAYQEYLSRFYGQSIQNWPSWLADEMKTWALAIVIGSAGLWGIYWLMRRSPNRWWIYAWLCAVPLQLAAVFLSPLVIEPMFYHFQLLEQEQPALVQEIERILARAKVEIPREHLLEMKASEKTNSLNAYVSGFGASKRLVLWDTIIAKERGAPLLTTVGHELGHYVLHHIRDGLLFGFAITLAGLLAMYAILKRFPPDPAPVPLLLLAASALAFAATPLVSGFSRMQEHEADRYALEVTHGIVPDSAQAAALAFQIEGESALADPNPSPFIEFWLYDHPPLAARLRFSLEYDPWRSGKPPRYVP